MSDLPAQKYKILMLNGTTVIDAEQASVKFEGGAVELPIHASMMRNAHSPLPYHPELQYLGLLQELVNLSDDHDKEIRDDRTGTRTFSVFGRSMRFPVGETYPLLTTKKVHFKSMLAELQWMLRGETNINTLDATIWDEWADELGELGPVYGKQWRDWDGIDQLRDIVQQIKTDPYSRRHVVSAWNVKDLPDMALSPCHCLFQFYVNGDGELDLQLYQRSADIFLGVPFNLASYAMLLTLVANEVRRKPGSFIHTFGDLHLYSNHVEQAKEQLRRTPMDLPTIELGSDIDMFDLKEEDVKLVNYVSHLPIKAEVSV